ncbi:hypothetical protein [Desulforhabdus sp. TSK]|uniref:hypothetical protein n=1 Tax=Desulforhabdus sp. TSK TaxID=2925014 RepID=UPI001FC8BAC3|nr:hypothetical protein [Desulforhabdus sp. TSK]GKT08978.1 hypothetical protein DSTSK_22830 [Desulforhabdus sp. TSK]
MRTTRVPPKPNWIRRETLHFPPLVKGGQGGFSLAALGEIMLITGKTLFTLLIVLAMMTSPSHAFTSQKLGNRSSTRPAGSPATPAAQPDIVVMNIILDRIQDGHVYSQDGRRFQITRGTKLIDNRNSGIKIRTAELFFVGGTLSTVIVR